MTSSTARGRLPERAGRDAIAVLETLPASRELGLAYVNLDNCPKGKEWIDKAVNVNPDDTAVQAAVQYYNENCLGSQAPPTRRPDHPWNSMR